MQRDRDVECRDRLSMARSRRRRRRRAERHCGRRPPGRARFGPRAGSAGRPWPKLSIDRTRAACAAGRTMTRSPSSTCPDQAVPVTTVPTPATENARSTGSRKTSADAARRPTVAALSAQALAEHVEPLPRLRRHGDRRLERHRRACQSFRHFEREQLEPLGIGKIGLGEHRNSGAARRGTRGWRGALRSAA